MEIIKLIGENSSFVLILLAIIVSLMGLIVRFVLTGFRNIQENQKEMGMIISEAVKDIASLKAQESTTQKHADKLLVMLERTMSEIVNVIKSK